jgi:hypothetical protein
MAFQDPTESGGLFIRRSAEGNRGLRYRGAPQRGGEGRQRLDRAIAWGLLTVELLLCLSLFGPQPLFWFWFGSQMEYWTGSVMVGILTILFGTLASLMLTVALAKRVDEVWKLVRRAAGHDQQRGALEIIFAVSTVVAVVVFSVWFLIVQGPGPTVAPGGG